MSGEAGWFSESFFQAVSLAGGADSMLAGFMFGLALAQLLLDFFADDVDGSVKILFNIGRVDIRAGERNLHGTGELAFGRLGLIVIKHHANVGGERVQMFDLVDLVDQMIFDGFRERHLMRHDDQVHANSMRRVWKKSTKEKNERGARHKNG